MARLSALIRRKNLYAPSGDWVINTPAQLLMFPENTVKPLGLSARELSILKIMVSNDPEYVTRIEMVEAMGENYRVYGERRLEKIISRLRKRLAENWSAAPLRRCVANPMYSQPRLGWSPVACEKSKIEGPV